MEALGTNLKKLSKQCPNKYFSPTTVYMITIQLVSKIQFVKFNKKFRIFNNIWKEHVYLKEKYIDILYPLFSHFD